MHKPQGKMGLVMMTALVSGNMVGSGVFLLPASLAKLGTITIFSWLLTAFGAMMLAFLFARLSLLIPRAGGPYVYARAGFGRFIGFQIAYSYWVTLWIGNAGLAIATVGYARVFLPGLDNALYAALFAIALIWIFTLINCRGARTAGWVQVITFICKLLPLLLIIILGWWHFHFEYFSKYYNLSHHSNWHAISHGASLTLWAFIGVESATVGAERSANPKRDIPLATLFGTLIASTIYILSSLVIMGMVPLTDLAHSTSPFALAAKLIFGNWGEYFITAGAIISCLGALNGWVLLQGQVAMNAAKDHYFPKFFAKKNKYEVPVWGLVFTSVLISALLFLTMNPNLVEQFSFIILLAVLTALIPYFYTSMAYMILAREFVHKRSSLVISIMIAVISGLYSYFAIIGVGEKIVYFGVLFLLTSFPLYVWTVHGRK